MDIDVYRNLNQNCLSVKSREPEDYGRVMQHCQKIHVDSPEFVVQPAGRERARRSGNRNVHAFVRGKWDDSLSVIDGEPVTYNPFEYDHFVHAETGEPVQSASVAVVTTRCVFAKDLRYRSTSR